MATDAVSEVTSILARCESQGRWSQTDQNRLLQLLYTELRRIASGLMVREQRAITLQPTALVHEAYLRLAGNPHRGPATRGHFLALAAKCMRNILVDHARARRAEKRGRGQCAVTLNEELVGGRGREFAALELHNALERFAQLDVRAAKVAEMKLFGGMTVSETANVLNVSERTVNGDWSTAKLWLSREFKD